MLTSELKVKKTMFDNLTISSTDGYKNFEKIKTNRNHRENLCVLTLLKVYF